MRLFPCLAADSPRITGQVDVDSFCSRGAISDLGYSVATVTPSSLAVTISASTHLQIIAAPSITLATVSITMPAAIDGLTIKIVSTGAISHINLTAPGTVISNAPTSLGAGTAIEFIFIASLGWTRLR